MKLRVLILFFLLFEIGISLPSQNNSDLINPINISGTTDLIISKTDVLEELNIYKLYYNNQIIVFENMQEMQQFIEHTLFNNCSSILKNILFSNNPYCI